MNKVVIGYSCGKGSYGAGIPSADSKILRCAQNDNGGAAENGKMMCAHKEVLPCEWGRVGRAVHPYTTYYELVILKGMALKNLLMGS